MIFHQNSFIKPFFMLFSSKIGDFDYFAIIKLLFNRKALIKWFFIKDSFIKPYINKYSSIIPDFNYFAIIKL